MSKICGRCQAEKSLSEFHPRSNTYDKVDYLCIQCRKLKDKEYYNTPAGRSAVRKAQKKYSKTKRGKESVAKRSFKHRRGNGRFSYAKYKAQYRGYSWGLQKEEYLSLVKNPCTYCNAEIPNGAIGLDRIDNFKGYDLENVLPCCPICNYARRNQFTVEEMKLFIGPAVAEIRKRRKEASVAT